MKQTHKSPENFDDIDDLAESLQQQIREMDASSEKGVEAEHDFVEELKHQLDEPLNTASVNKGKPKKTSRVKLLIFSLMGLLALLLVMTYVFLFLSNNTPDFEQNATLLALPKHETSNQDKPRQEPKLIEVEDDDTIAVSVNDSNNKKHTDVLLEEENAAVVKKIPLVFLEDEVMGDGQQTKNSDYLPQQHKITEPSALIEKEKEKEVLQLDLKHQEKITEIPAPHQSKELAEPKGMLKSLQPNPMIGMDNRQWLSIIGENFKASDEIKLSWNNHKKSKLLSVKSTPKQFNFVNSNLIKIYISTGKQKDTWSLQLNADKKSVSFEVVPPFSKNKKKSKVKAAKAIPLDYFTVQLLAASKLLSIKNIIANNSHIKGLRWIKTNRNGQAWYNLVYGAFKSKEVAIQAYSKLPKSLQKNRPWYRRLNAFATDQSVKKLGNKEKGEWTLQLVNLMTITAVNRYIENNKLGKQAKAIKRLSNGNIRFTLIYGQYKNQQAAKAAIEKLPENVKISKPWVKRIKDIR